jgi:hypothetical protein
MTRAYNAVDADGHILDHTMEMMLAALSVIWGNLTLIGNSCRPVRHVAGALITAMCRTACVHATAPHGA